MFKFLKVHVIAVNFNKKKPIHSDVTLNQMANKTRMSIDLRS